MGFHKFIYWLLYLQYFVLLARFLRGQLQPVVFNILYKQFSEFRHHRDAISYHPKMMFKVVLYPYTQSVFSGRKTEKLLNDNIRMMWLS